MENNARDDERPVWREAMEDRWSEIFDTIATILFCTYFLAVFILHNPDWIIWGSFLFALIHAGRVFGLTRAMRKGTARPVKVLPRQRLLLNWMWVLWFFVFGVTCLIFTRPAPWYAWVLMGTTVLVAAGAGISLLLRKRPAASDRSAT